MFSAIKRRVANLKKFNQDKELSRILSSPTLQAQIVDLNQKQLYEQGIQADGTSTGQYAPITINYYKPLAKAEGRDGRTDHVTFKDTGATYDSMRVEVEPDGVVITANDDTGVFERMKTPKALGMTPESISEILPEIRTEIVSTVKKLIHA